MTSRPRSKSMLIGTFEFLELVYHSVVREVRTESGNATFGVLKEVGQMAIFLGMFYVFYLFMGRTSIIRGDFMMFLCTGIILMVVHMKAISSAKSASLSTSAIMQHAPMTAILSILAKAFGGLYLQSVAVIIIVSVLWIFGMDMTVKNPGGLVLPFIFTWASGIAVGMIFLMVTPIAPGPVNIFSRLYMRAQMVTSGKFLPAGYMPTLLVGWFSWNPLFHCIDQARLATFVNYNKEVSSMSYPIWFTAIVLLIGLMGEFWTRKNFSQSRHGR